MKEQLKVLSQFAYLEVFKVKCSTGVDIKGWIANQNYLFEDDSAKETFILAPYHSEKFVEALTNDFNKMAIASFESISAVQKNVFLSKSFAWAVIETYYSAFFAAHAFLRVFGRACTQLGAEHSLKINEMKSATSSSEKNVCKGFYYICATDNASKKISFSRLSESHKDTWRCFLCLLNELIEKVETATAMKERIIETRDLLISIKKNLAFDKCKTHGNWLSSIRNEVNYRHTHNVWFPYGTKRDVDKLYGMISTAWKRKPDINMLCCSGQEIDKFINTAVFLISFLKEFIISNAIGLGEKKSTTNTRSVRLINLLS